MKYIARAGIPFVVPVHSAIAPDTTVGATAVQIAEVIRAYNQDLADVTW